MKFRIKPSVVQESNNPWQQGGLGLMAPQYSTKIKFTLEVSEPAGWKHLHVFDAVDSAKLFAKQYAAVGKEEVFDL